RSSRGRATPIVVPTSDPVNPRPGARVNLVVLLPHAEAKDGDGSVPSAVERLQVNPRQTRGGVEPGPVAEQQRQDVHQDLVHQTPLQALTGYVSAENFKVLASRGGQGRGDRFPDVAGEVRDSRGRRVGWPMGEDERRSGEGVPFVA